MNRTVAVTCGSGKLGRAVVAALIVEGWTVVNFDRVPHRTAKPTSYARTSPTTARLSRPSPASTRFTAASMPLATRSITHRRTCHSTRTSQLHQKSSTPSPRISKRRWPASIAAGTQIKKMIGLRFSNVIDPSEYADFPSFENDPASRKWNLWLHRRP